PIAEERQRVCECPDRGGADRGLLGVPGQSGGNGYTRPLSATGGDLRSGLHSRRPEQARILSQGSVRWKHYSCQPPEPRRPEGAAKVLPIAQPAGRRRRLSQSAIYSTNRSE